jgi:hypothetical protein
MSETGFKIKDVNHALSILESASDRLDADVGEYLESVIDNQQTEIDNLKRELAIYKKALGTIISAVDCRGTCRICDDIGINPVKCASIEGCEDIILNHLITKAKESSEEGGG